MWDKAGVQEESQAWNEPLTVIPGVSPRDGALDLSGTGYLLSAMTNSDGGYLVRLYNAAGDASPKNVKIAIPAKKVEEVNLLGEKTGNPKVSKDDNGIIMEVSIPRFGIKTFKID